MVVDCSLLLLLSWEILLFDFMSSVCQTVLNKLDCKFLQVIKPVMMSSD